MISQKKLNQLKKYFAAQLVDAVYLFGSQATGKNTKLSDADLAVLFKKGLSKSRRFDLRLDIIGEVCGILQKERVDVMDLQEAPLRFRYQAILPGKVILVKNRKRMIALEKDILKKYLDLKPYFYHIAQRQMELTAEGGFAYE